MGTETLVAVAYVQCFVLGIMVGTIGGMALRIRKLERRCSKLKYTVLRRLDYESQD